MRFLFGWITFCIIVGLIGREKTIGFWGTFILSFFFSPVLGLIIALASKKKGTLPKHTRSYPTQVKYVKPPPQSKKVVSSPLPKKVISPPLPKHFGSSREVERLITFSVAQYLYGDYDGALRDLKEALSLAPRNPTVHINMASIYCPILAWAE